MGEEGFGIDPKVLDRMALEIGQLVGIGVQVGLVIGGGNLFRGAALSAAGMERVTGDHMGMLATMMNALAMRDALDRNNISARVMSAIPMSGVVDHYDRRKAMRYLDSGRAHPSLLDGLTVSYYGSDTPLSQVGNVSVLDARTLSVSVWEKSLVPEVEKAILKSDLGLNPSTSGELIRIPMPALTEETRKGFIKQARSEAESARISIRNIRRDVLSDVKDLLKEKEITEDEDHKAQDEIQKITDKYIKQVDEALAAKEIDLMEI
ncbi:UNVERIFIED_CONTAM: hypothetical protein GTU68_007165 [Idotea baltica]|nr:hypothetical protein [Idotea baltica]